jgi:hypothetical protein
LYLLLFVLALQYRLRQSFQILKRFKKNSPHLKHNDIIPLYSIGKDHKLYQGIKLFHFGSKSETILKDSMAQDIFNFTRISGVMECYFS